MVLWCGLKPAARCIGSGCSWEGAGQRLATICACLGAAYWELQHDLHLVATCAVLRGTCEMLCSKPRLGAPSAGLGTLWLASQYELRTAPLMPGLWPLN